MLRGIRRKCVAGEDDIESCLMIDLAYFVKSGNRLKFVNVAVKELNIVIRVKVLQHDDGLL